jgi:hypothetical protein
MAKGQKKCNREICSPKAAKPKPVAATPSYLPPEGGARRPPA